MKLSWNSCAKRHEVQNLVIALDKLGEDFGHNRDTYYSLGRYLGYTDLSLLRLESQANPLSQILCDIAAKKVLSQRFRVCTYIRTIFYYIWSLG